MHVRRVEGREDEPIWVIDGFFAEEECEALIAHSNQIQVTENGDKPWHAPNTGGKYTRAMMSNRKLADVIEKRLKPILPEIVNDCKTLYVNDRFRFSRYSAGGEFHVHCDGKNYDNKRPELTGEFSAESLLTANAFLNTEGDEDYDLVGGGTTFFHGEGDENGGPKQCGLLRESIPAKAGRLVLFWANQYHQGDLVVSGRKYLVRTDIMGQRCMNDTH